ncbi:alkane 1-monooxygenase [Jannaschia formosa]|uniref:alkane 1-monooxygenase n=1 Tax=Jannaschia formosa TaxID=2259592 RepID=UPI000E1BE264|nr:alkane 1-monooxygenase [Jannaschia formosa]TFL18421.1 alkane 1-monooxygenase [Jannaschia formosa]
MTVHALPDQTIRNPLRALPFWISLTLVPIVWAAALLGGWWVLIVPLYSWGAYSLLDALAGLEEGNADPQMDRAGLGWYRAITLVWAPVQAATLFALIWYATRAEHLGGWELFGLFFGMGILSGTVGINYAHELMHQKPRLDRWMADILLAMVFYSHFRSEHLLVHHRYVATPRDPVTARYNEGFHRFYPRVLRQCLVSAWQAEAAMLARKGLGRWHRSNPFWRYAALQAAVLALAFALGGGLGVVLVLVQAGVAIWQLELVNYIEHYGLTRRHLGDGRYEPVRPHHSWNSAQKASNWLLINLQRHSDHHYKPDRPFPLLQTYAADEAPQLPAGYPVMTAAAMVPPVWRRMMNPRVREWRRRWYPDIEDWSAYKTASNPPPR